MKTYYYLKIFLIFSILGFFYESTIRYINNKIFDSGIFYLTWTPIYGLGVVIIMLIYQKSKKLILTVPICIFVLTIYELLYGVLNEIIFNKVLWSYTDLKYNIGTYISLEATFIWTLGALLIPLILKKIKIEKISNSLTFFVFGIFILDLITSIFTHYIFT